jgi:hypothetical protein
MLRLVFGIALAWLATGRADAATRFVRAGEDLQAALNAAQPGDELRLEAGATFSGNFVLPVTSGRQMITVRTDLADSALPGPLQRVTPSTAAPFAKIVSPNSAAALRTAAGAHHWTLAFLEFPSNKDGYGDIIQLGDGSSAQSQVSQVPYQLVLDHLYVHGHPLYGQKRGIALNAATVTIRNSYISDIKTVGADAQAIGGWNGPGPFSIENNYLEAAAENFLLGGSDPSIPNLVSSDVLVRFNYMTRPMAWRDPIIPTPTGVAAAAVSGGSLPAGSYGYRVVARRSVGQGTIGNSVASAEVGVTSPGGSVRITWTPVTAATEYWVYGRTTAGETQYWATSGPAFTDTGAAGKPGTPPSDGSRWQIKNVFELKNARRVDVEYNVFENNWLAAQPGYAIVFTPRNQDGACTWCVIESVEFAHNIVRNSSAGLNISGRDSPNVSQITTGLNIHDNLFYGITTHLGGNGWAILIGDGPRTVTFDHNTFDFDGTTLLYAYGGSATAPKTVVPFQFTNNAARHNDYGINGADASTGTLTLQMYFPGSIVTGNWLSGGSASRYPAGNRFDVPFDNGLATASSSTVPSTGANVAKLMPLLTTVPQGLMTGVPQAPKNVRIISSGR